MSSWAMLCGWAGLALFGVVNGPGLRTAAILALALVCSALRGRWEISLRHFAGLGVAFLVASGLFDGIDFYGAALGLAGVQCLAFLRRYRSREELGACFVSAALAMACTFTDRGNPLVLGILVLILLTALICSLRLNVVGSSWSPAAVLALLLSFPVGAAMAGAVRAAEDGVARLWGGMTASGSGSFGFPPTSRLDTLQSRQSDTTVVLRYRSLKPPRYLVAMVYASFDDNSWKYGGGGDRVLYQAGPEGMSAYFLYSGSPPTADMTDSVEVADKGQEIFLPRDCYQFYLVPSERLRASGVHIEGTVRHRGNTFEACNGNGYEGRYQLQRSAETFTARRDDKPGEQEDYLQLPPQLSPLVARLASEHSQGSDTQKARQLESFLQDNYTYGFGYPFSRSVDPVGDFLSTKPPAHCELFATSLTLMLRTLRIPCRYVNGLVVREQGKESGDWVVRVRDAHAWVEAYLEGRWVTLDPTPPSARLENPPVDWKARVMEWLGQLSYSGLLKGLLGVCGLGALGYWARRWRWRRRVVERQVGDELSVILGAFQKAVGLRPTECTLAAWARQLPEDARAFLEVYSRLRYGQASVSGEELAELDGLLGNLRAELPGKQTGVTLGGSSHHLQAGEEDGVADA